MAPAAALESTRTLRVKPRPPTPHPSTSCAPVHPKQAKTRGQNECMQGDLGTISRVQGGWRAATHLSLPQERPIGAPQVLARQAKHPGGGRREKRPHCQHAEHAGSAADSWSYRHMLTFGAGRGHGEVGWRARSGMDRRVEGDLLDVLRRSIVDDL